MSEGVVNYSIKHALCGEIGGGVDEGDEGDAAPPMTKLHLFPDLGTCSLSGVMLFL